MLYRWKQSIEDQKQGLVMSEDERDKLKRLRKENKELQMEKDILKKASDFFAKEMKREYRVKSWSVNYYQIKTFT